MKIEIVFLLFLFCLEACLVCLVIVQKLIRALSINLNVDHHRWHICLL